MKMSIKTLTSLALTAALASGCTKNVTNNVPGSTPLTGDPRANSATQSGSESGNSGGGVINGGGGRGVLCHKNGQTTVEVLDLYEARHLYGLTPVSFGDSLDEAKKNMIIALVKHFWNPWTVNPDQDADAQVKAVDDQFTNKIHFLDAGTHLKQVDDSYEPTLEIGCEPVQIAHYYDESVLLVDKEYWDQLDATNKAALIAHEAVYFMAREGGETNSMATRKLVGRIFSKEGVRTEFDGAPKEKSKMFSCPMTKDGFFAGTMWLYDSKDENGSPAVEAIFQNQGGRATYFRTSAIFGGGVTLKNFLTTAMGSTNAQVSVDTYPNRDDIQMNLPGPTDDGFKTKLTWRHLGQNAFNETYDVNCAFSLNGDLNDLKTLLGVKDTEAGKYKSTADSTAVIHVNSLEIKSDGSAMLTEGFRVTAPNAHTVDCTHSTNALVLNQTNAEIDLFTYSYSYFSGAADATTSAAYGYNALNKLCEDAHSKGNNPILYKQDLEKVSE